ncbi:MAG TPA: VOC family protein [Aggregatilineales bacterium]|nr:VOC family protein [Aggregatilineales bacterium]
MFKAIGTVCLFVNDQDKAKAFWVDKVGLELRSDMPMGPSRWVAVAPKGSYTEMILYKLDENWEHYRNVVGKSQAITLDVTDMSKVHDELKAKGVKFVLEPEKQMWGTQAIIQDDEGNQVILIQRAQM